MIDWKPRAQALADQLATAGHLRTSDWQKVFATVPRHEFVPSFYEHTSPGQWQRIEGTDATQRDRWLSAVYSNTTLVTAVEDVTLPRAPGQRSFAVAVSSSTEPGLMAQMLEDLDVHTGHTVLEIGTGTGYNAALLCERLGDTQVHSVDLRADHVDAAALRLAQAGHHPTLAAADGADGLPNHGCYDRIIATCSVQYIPPAWIDQLHPGGMLLADLEGTIYAGNLAALSRQNNSTLQGRFCAQYGSFMPMQHQLGIHPGRSHRTNPDPGTERTTTLPPDVVHQRQRPFAFYAQLHLPHSTQLQPAAAGTRTRLVAPDGSWCEVTDRSDTSGHHHVIEGGPQRLWQLIEQAHERYIALGYPGWECFGITATPSEQRIWLDTPGNVANWPIPMTGAP
ncbi:MAG: methyltransferase domain-containing protein [Pseudonocardiaceae bacterium]